jgi:DNA-binding response OmpR family regulator
VDAPAILVVEDDELVRSFLVRALAGMSTSVDGVATGAEATAAIDHRHYSAVLLDGLLPDTHGVDLAQRLIEHPNALDTGICFVSGSLRRSLPMRSGVCALPKPLRIRELCSAVEELLTWHRSGTHTVPERRAAIDVLAADLLVR